MRGGAEDGGERASEDARCAGRSPRAIDREQDEDWDIVAIGAYLDRTALLALFDDEAYRAAWADQVAAVARQRVLIAAG